MSGADDKRSSEQPTRGMQRLMEDLRRRELDSLSLGATPLPAGTLVGDKYQILQHLGGGNMGDVLLATQNGLEKRGIALKIIKPNKIGGAFTSEVAAESRDRFVREVQLTRKLAHVPGVVPVLDSGEFRGLPYYVMDFITGIDLHAMLETNGPFEAKQAAKLMARIAWVVQAVHDRGVVHRDLKPRNLMVSGMNTVHVVDFGLAAEAVYTSSPAASPMSPPSREGLGVNEAIPSGTPIYMAPERCPGKDTASEAGNRPEADVFSLGATLWQVFTGTWTATEWEQAVNSRLDLRPLEKASVPLVLQEICKTALPASEDHRYRTAAAFADALDTFVRSHFPPDYEEYALWQAWNTMRSDAHRPFLAAQTCLILFAGLLGWGLGSEEIWYGVAGIPLALLTFVFLERGHGMDFLPGIRTAKLVGEWSWAYQNRPDALAVLRRAGTALGGEDFAFIWLLITNIICPLYTGYMCHLNIVAGLPMVILWVGQLALYYVGHGMISGLYEEILFGTARHIMSNRPPVP